MLVNSIERSKSRAEEGELDAQFILGYHLLYGVDKCEAFKWFKHAADSGHIELILDYGRGSVDEEGVAMVGFSGSLTQLEAGYAASQYRLNRIHKQN